MNPVRALHDKAMDFAELAYSAKRQGNLEAFDNFSLQAFELEVQAANQVFGDISAEPTRSVLYRSAASLAIDCKKYPEAVRLIEIALGGNPPAEIREELRELLEQANFYRHPALPS
ncbi:MAG: hypothetical protein WCS37_11710 [Chloroflexota bacterium]|nr:hypothetical protein [Chloroflexota bacterium]